MLVAEACTHVPDTEDIGRVKIPALLRKRAGGSLQVDIAAGNDFPEDLSLAGVPITNYGIALAALNGILGRISIP